MTSDGRPEDPPPGVVPPGDERSDDGPADGGQPTDVAARAVGSWVRVPEEDYDGVQVYVPRGTPLPPARGRRGLDLSPDGTAVEVGIGRDDTELLKTARWSAPSSDRLRIETEQGVRSMRVVRADEDRLEVATEEDDT